MRYQCQEEYHQPGLQCCSWTATMPAATQPVDSKLDSCSLCVCMPCWQEMHDHVLTGVMMCRHLLAGRTRCCRRQASISWTSFEKKASMCSKGRCQHPWLSAQRPPLGTLPQWSCPPAGSWTRFLSSACPAAVQLAVQVVYTHHPACHDMLLLLASVAARQPA